MCVLIWILMWMSVFWHRSPKSSLSLTCHSILIKDKQDQSCEAGLWRIGSIVHHLLAYAVPIFQFANFPMTFRQKDFYNASEKRKLFSGGWQNEKKVWENIEMYYAWKNVLRLMQSLQVLTSGHKGQKTTPSWPFRPFVSSYWWIIQIETLSSLT